jgi:hypothetical protein
MEISADLYEDFEFFRRYFYDASKVATVRSALQMLFEHWMERDERFKAALERDRTRRRNISVLPSKE